MSQLRERLGDIQRFANQISAVEQEWLGYLYDAFPKREYVYGVYTKHLYLPNFRRKSGDGMER